MLNVVWARGIAALSRARETRPLRKATMGEARFPLKMTGFFSEALPQCVCRERKLCPVERLGFPGVPYLSSDDRLMETLHVECLAIAVEEGSTQALAHSSQISGPTPGKTGICTTLPPGGVVLLVVRSDRKAYLLRAKRGTGQRSTPGVAERGDLTSIV